MARPQTPRADAIAKVDAILERYRTSRLTRRQYCEREGISLSMLDYYQRRRRQLGNPPQDQQRLRPAAALPTRPPQPTQRLVRVHVGSKRPSHGSSQSCTDPLREASAPGFVLTLSNGRRIESQWGYQEQELITLIRIVEAA